MLTEIKNNNKNLIYMLKNQYIIYKIFVVALLFPMLSFSDINAQIMTVNGNVTIYLKSGSVLAIKGGLNLKSNASIIHDNSGISNFYLSGKFNNLGTYTQNSYGILRFYGLLADTISGNDLTLERLWVTKTGSNMLSLAEGTDLILNKSLRLISNNILNINRSNLTLEVGAMIYPDSVSVYTTDPLTDPFSDAKHISTSGEVLLSGKIIRKIEEITSLTTDKSIRFPLGTPNDTSNPTQRYYTPARYVFNAGMVTADAGAYISMKCIASEHPSTEVKLVALRKYWKTEYDIEKISVAPGGYNVRFNYNQNEVQGFEEFYLLNLFFRPKDSTFYINPGDGYGIEPINNRFYVDEVNQKDTLGNTQVLLDGEWSAGQEEAISTFYYSIANGDWNSASTWSKQGYGGVASATIPSTLNDKVFIGNGKTVTVSTSSTAEINKIEIENTGRLLISNPVSVIQGDSLFLRAGGTLAISSPDGFHTTGSIGHIRTIYTRNYSTNGIYEFVGSENQVTGPGIPDIVNSIIINKSASNNTVSLSKSVLIRDSLVINEGKYHLFLNGNYTSNGETGDTTNRLIIMRGGEFVMQSFPTKYKNGNFDAGTITFDGTGSFRVPSSTSPSPGEPAVTQYHNLKFTGARTSNTFVTLDPTGEIRVQGLLDISGLTFDPTPISDRFLVTGSKVIFNGSSDQQIQTGYSSNVGLNYRLKFHELIIDGTGNKNILDPNDILSSENYVLVRSHLRIKNGTLKSNNYWIKCLGNWTCDSNGDFDAGSGLVTFEADGKITNIASNGSSFKNVRIMGTYANGYVNFTDSLNISGNLEINPNTLRSLNGSSLSIQGNWYNKGVFTANTGRVYFNGTGDQILDHNGEGTFYQITVNKPSGMVRLNGDSLIKISNNLTLTKGNIGGRLSDSVANKPLVVDGSITRPIGTPGHIDGRLRLPTVEGANSVLYPIGYADDYNPLQLTINGSGGRAGYLDGYILTDSQAPNLNSTVIATQLPNGAELDNTKNVQKVWVLNADSTLPINQRFLLQSSSRNFDLEIFYLNSDIRGGANYNNFVVSQRDSTINTNRWTYPFVSSVNSNSIKIAGNTNLKNYTGNYFMTGEPQIFTYYSIANGDFNSLATWSIYGYLGTENPSRLPVANDNIRIGNGKTVTFYTTHTINAGRTFVVETGGTGYPNGHLQFTSDTSRIWGAGTFRLDSGAAITILHAEGISTSSLGCIRTTTRNYNNGNHDRGNFIYARNGSQATGNGLPVSMQTLKVDLGVVGNTLTFTGTSPIIRQVWDSLYLATGTTNLSTVIMKLGGNFKIDSLATFTPGSTTIGSNANMATDSTTLAGGFLFNGNSEQWIYRTGIDSMPEIVFNRIGLAKQGGKVRSRSNIKSNQFFFHNVNRANFDVQSYNKYLNCSSPTAPGILRKGSNSSDAETNLSCLPNPIWGWIEGRLVRNAANNTERVFIIGTQYGYSPVHIYATHTTSSADFIEAHVEEGNHPDFKSNQINPNTNIQRYYEFTRTVTPASTFSFASTNSMKIGILFTDDEPRGGIDPNTYSVFRLDSNKNWTRTNNIALLSGDAAYPNNDTTRGVNVTATGLALNKIFAVTSQFSSAPSITLMVGEPTTTGDRVFYSKNSGNWSSPSTWANEAANTLYANTETGYALIGNASGTYPQSSTTFRDYVVIGDGDSVNFDVANVDLQYVLVEKSVNGIGKLRIPGTNYFRTDQYVQKNGGKLIIGSPDGIVANSSTNGSVRRLSTSSIINFDWNQLGVNHFSYIGTAAQATGSGLPARMASLEINNTGGAVTLTNDVQLTITDSLIFRNGTLLNQNGNRTISLKGDLVTHTNNSGINTSSNRALIMDSTRNQQIRGNADSTVIPNTLTINKTSGTVTANQNVRFNSVLDVQSNTLFNLADNKMITFGDNATISNIDSFRVNRMIKVSGTLNSGKLRKTFSTGTNTSRTFTFPVGDASYGYGEAKYDLNNMDFGTNNFLEFALISVYPHYSLTGTPNVLKKYWRTNTSAITLNNGNTNVRFRYNDNEVVGNILDYAPALYRRTDVSSLDPGWSSTIFASTNLQIDTTNKYIIADNAQTLPNHDWTAGSPSTFATGKIYWSRTSGDWTNPNTWTNITSSGNHNSGNVVALNYPGFYEGDVVYIGANHVVNYNNTVANPIDSVGIGITSPSTAPELQFGTVASSNKILEIDGSLMIGSTGSIVKIKFTFSNKYRYCKNFKRFK